MSISYELAKRLKDAGFPHVPLDDGNYYREKGESLEDSFIMIPTLSQLIEACGDRNFKTLMTTDGEGKEWVAMGVVFDGPTYGSWTTGKGSTPEEAVSLLYLALNEKKQ